MAYNGEQGLSNTKFHKGFYRKSESNVVNEVSNIEKAHKANKQGKSDQLAVARQERLTNINARNGYDPITGAQKLSRPPETRNESIRFIGPDVLGPEAPLRGQIMLRDSTNRFFTPHPSGYKQEYRQKLIQTEGLLKQKTSGILSSEKHDLHSYGIDDNFSKSNYIKLSKAASTGLTEASVPGKYSPEKQPGNPSGDPIMKATWTNGIKL
eukprot:CAMPEP_0182428232 /NCGR_PEP_ID=MMETSP1167-20130531/21676_1 /TAXON_ID=2988 /ORGANISM="Mallomonas Sp, Strain CCMP3275" /LENGTH=209 /DNA_ID=CAMNT_0024610987 /DNA_START=329 /DNA_END=958 /DNA_ORIENTATION=-